MEATLDLTKTEHALPYELLQVAVGSVVCALPVLRFVHGTVHARLEESSCRRIGPWRDKLEDFIFISLIKEGGNGRKKRYG